MRFRQYSPLTHSLPCRHIQQGLAFFSFPIYLLTYLLIIRNNFSFLIKTYVTSTFGCKDNKKQGKRYTLPILFSYLGVNLRIIITITYFTSIISAENHPHAYAIKQNPRSSQTRETLCYTIK
nr:MAG TPA: hypothetical protein [Caudoviricetes sp.]